MGNGCFERTLAEEGTHTDIEVNCEGLRYGSSDRMYYVPSRSFEEYLRTVTDEQLADVKSKLAAAYYARQEGCTTGKKIICKQCRIKQRMIKCGLQKRHGTAGKDGSGACLGFGIEWDDEPIEQCKRCIACASFDWDAKKKRLSL